MSCRWIRATAVVIIFLAFKNAALASETLYTKVFSDKYASGNALVHAWFDLLSKTGSPAGTLGTSREQNEASRKLVMPYLDPGFQLQRSTGQRYTAETFIPADIDYYALDQIQVTRPTKDIVVARYFARTTEALPGEEVVMSEKEAPRLTVFHWSSSESRWRILSHANFNTPIAAICDKKPFVDSAWKPESNISDQALGERLMNNFFTLIEKGDAKPALHPLIQYQSANGFGYTTLAERKSKTQYAMPTLGKPTVTRNGNLLVVSQHHTTQDRVLMGKYERLGGKSSLLGTFLSDDKHAWRLISFASFAPAKNLPKGVQCK